MFKRKSVAILSSMVLSMLAPGWSWAAQPHKCGNDDVTNQVAVEILKAAGGVLHKEGISFSAGIPGVVQNASPPISFSEFDKLIPMSMSLYRERGYDADTKKRYCSADLSVEKAPDPTQAESLYKKIPYKNVVKLAGLAGRLDYTIQIIDDGTELVRVGD